MQSAMLDSLGGLVTPQLVADAAERLGEPQAAVARGLRGGLTATLAGLAWRASDSGMVRQLYDLVRSNEPSLDTDASQLVDAVRTPGSPLASAASQLATLAFGPGGLRGVEDSLASTAGVRRESASALLGVSLPLVLGFLSRRVRDGRLDAAQLGNLLLAQREPLREALPAGLAGALGLASMPPSMGEPARVEPRAAAMPPRGLEPPQERRSSWLVPALAGVAALAVLGFCTLGRDRARDTVAVTDSAGAVMRANADTAGGALRGAVGSAAGAVSTAAGDVAAATGDAAARLGAFVKRSLPGGVELNVPERGIESRLVAYIADPARPVTDTTWFEFDRLTFETGSANLRPESREQLGNIAAILKAYPSVNAKVGGYTDSVGNDAANLKLSQDRAANVRRELVGMGVGADRLTAEGYGEQHPVADNATEEGRAQNRRIALRVTKK